MSDFGAGPFLTRDLDFEVTTTGDIRTVDGQEELEKDIAVQALIELDELMGEPMSTNTEARVAANIRQLLNNEPRIDSVTNVNITFLNARDEVEVVANVVTDNTEQELVFQI